MAALNNKNNLKEMMMKTKVLMLGCILIVISFVHVHAQNGKSKLTLQTCLDIALANYIPVKQSELLEQNAKANFDQAKYNRLPNIAADMNYGINNGRSIDPYTNGYSNQQLSSSNATLAANIPVFRGFQINNSIKQSSLTYEASKMELQQEKDNLTLSVILSFLQLMNDEDVLVLTKTQMEVTQKQVERLELMNKEGAIAPSVLSDVKGQYATDQLSVLTSTRSVETSKLTLLQFMNIPYDKGMRIDREGFEATVALYEGSTDKIYTTALQNLAMVKAVDLRVKAATKGIKVAAADFYPTLSLFGQLGTNYSSAASISTPVSVTDVPTSDYVVVSGSNLPVITKQTNYNTQKINFSNQYNNNLGTYFGVSLRVPIFSAFQSRTNVRLARIEEKRNTYVAENTRIRLRQAIELAHLNMTTAYERYKIVSEQVTAFQESFRAAEIRFNLGALNSVDYLIIKNNFDRATVNLTIARYEYLLRTKVLDFYQGNLR